MSQHIPARTKKEPNSLRNERSTSVTHNPHLPASKHNPIQITDSSSDEDVDDRPTHPRSNVVVDSSGVDDLIANLEGIQLEKIQLPEYAPPTQTPPTTTTTPTTTSASTKSIPTSSAPSTNLAKSNDQQRKSSQQQQEASRVPSSISVPSTSTSTPTSLSSSSVSTARPLVSSKLPPPLIVGGVLLPTLSAESLKENRQLRDTKYGTEKSDTDNNMADLTCMVVSHSFVSLLSSQLI